MIPPHGRDLRQAGVQLAVGDARQVRAHRADRAERRQALRGVIAMQLDVLLDQAGQEQVPARRQGAALEEDPIQ